MGLGRNAHRSPTSAAAADIVVILHRYDRIDSPRFFAGEFAKIWESQGRRVRVVQSAQDHVEAPLAILQVDLTVVPDEYLALARRYPRVLNGRVVDISKRRICSNVVKRRDGYDGPVW